VFTSQDDRGSAVAYLGAIAHLEMRLELRVLQEVRIGIARGGCLLKSHLDRGHVGARVTVGIRVGFDGEMRQVTVRYPIGFFIGFGTAGEQGWEGKIIDRPLSGIMRSAGQIVRPFARSDRRLHLGTRDQYNVKSSLDGLNRTYDPHPAGGTRSLDARAADTSQTLIRAPQHRP